jgi:thioredoxin
VLYAQPGALPEKALEELITKAEALDMDEVRASVAQAEAKTEAQAGAKTEAQVQA